MELKESLKKIAVVLVMMVMGSLSAVAQADYVDDDSTFVAPPLVVPQEDSTAISILADTTVVTKKKGRDWNTWRPNPKRALWLALVLPGAGQIYNRKYWKLPIFYGGMVGCIYALTWNGQMYDDYSQAYMDIMDDDPNTKSYDSFLQKILSGTLPQKKRPLPQMARPKHVCTHRRICALGNRCLRRRLAV